MSAFTNYLYKILRKFHLFCAPFNSSGPGMNSNVWQRKCLYRCIGFSAVAGSLSVGMFSSNRNWRCQLYDCWLTPLLQTCQMLGYSSPSKVVGPEPAKRPDLPFFSMEEVEKHGKGAKRQWVTYRQGVYDITDFVQLHPGGEDKILLAAGGTLEPFWSVYAQHKTEQVVEILEGLRIGNLDPRELEGKKMTKETEMDDPFASDPARHPALVINSQKPFNAETPASLLGDSFLTPNSLFFVRNHLPVPQVDENEHRIVLEGIAVDEPISISVEELKRKFEPVSIVAAVQCAGNRRNDMNNFKKVQGLMWTGTAISNAEWTGCRLRDVLMSAGIRPDDQRIKHVHLEGADTDSEGNHYGSSIPFAKAMSKEVILAYEMNGEPLPVDHGFPVRTIIPGTVGARQVKWLTGIRTSREESQSHWQQRDYKAFPNNVQIGDYLPYATTPSIQEFPVQSAICVPVPNTKIQKDLEKIRVSGYAWSGGGRGIIRVEVSADGGKNWTLADLEQSADQELDQMWAWTQWNVDLPVPRDAISRGTFEVVCKATDRAYNTQPESAVGIWNVRGLLHNAWHRVPIVLDGGKDSLGK